MIKDIINKVKNIEPDYSFESLCDITPEDIKRTGAKAIILDLDNTTVLYGEYTVRKEMCNWVSAMKNAGLPVVVVSNTFALRGRVITSRLGAFRCYSPAFKPLPFAARKAAADLGLKPGQVVMIGDTLKTDVLCANITGAVSIKVEPLAKANILVFYRSIAEQLVLLAAKHIEKSAAD